jgi:hypothetical protein
MMVPVLTDPPDGFKATLLGVGLALLLAGVFAGARIGPLDIPRLRRRQRLLGGVLGIAVLGLGVAASLPAAVRARVVIRVGEAAHVRNGITLVAENHGDVLATPNRHVACRPTEGSWTRGDPPQPTVPLAPTFTGGAGFPRQPGAGVQRLDFRLTWNFAGDPGRLPLRGRLACVDAYRVNAEAYEAARFDLAYVEAAEFPGSWSSFLRNAGRRT